MPAPCEMQLLMVGLRRLLIVSHQLRCSFARFKLVVHLLKASLSVPIWLAGTVCAADNAREELPTAKLLKKTSAPNVLRKYSRASGRLKAFNARRALQPGAAMVLAFSASDSQAKA
jgi:hypothetical protein